MPGQSWKDKYGTSEEVVVESADFTAHAGGGQTNATALNKKFCRINVCATNGDSNKLIAGKVGMKQYVFNDTAHDASVFPVSGEKINGVTNAEITVFAGNLFIFECVADGIWFYQNTPI